MDDVTQVAVVRSRRIAHHRVHLCRLGHWQFWPRIEPHRRIRSARVLARKVANDDGRLQSLPQCRAGERAGDKHRRVLDRLRREVGCVHPSQKLGQLGGDGHGVAPSKR